MTRKRIKQAVIIKASVNKNNKRADVVNLTIAGVGFVTAGLQIAVGMGMVGSVAGAIPGALLIAHGTNNIIENGYYILYRDSYTGPVKFIYEGVGAQFGMSKRDADVIYTAVDISLSINGMVSYGLTVDAARLYRYLNTGPLWGLKSMGIKNMSTTCVIAGFFGGFTTIYIAK